MKITRNLDCQLLIDGKPLFCEGKYLCGIPYKRPIIIKSLKEFKMLEQIASKINYNIPYPFEILNFEYNGFMGQTKKGIAPYKARFVKWSGDPGVAIMECSDGKIRYIPTFAIPGSVLIPDDKMNHTGMLFGFASSSN